MICFGTISGELSHFDQTYIFQPEKKKKKKMKKSKIKFNIKKKKNKKTNFVV